MGWAAARDHVDVQELSRTPHWLLCSTEVPLKSRALNWPTPKSIPSIICWGTRKKGWVLPIQSCRIAMTPVNNRIPRKNPGEDPVWMVSQKPRSWTEQTTHCNEHWKWRCVNERVCCETNTLWHTMASRTRWSYALFWLFGYLVACILGFWSVCLCVLYFWMGKVARVEGRWRGNERQVGLRHMTWNSQRILKKSQNGLLKVILNLT